MPFLKKSEPLIFNNQVNFNQNYTRIRKNSENKTSKLALETFNKLNSDQKRSFMMNAKNKAFLFNHINFICKKEASANIELLVDLAAKNLKLAEKTLELLTKHKPELQKDFLNKFFVKTEATPGQFTSQILFTLTRDETQKKEFLKRLENGYTAIYEVLKKQGQKLVYEYLTPGEGFTFSVGFNRTSKCLKKRKVEESQSALPKLEAASDRTIEENNNALQSQYEFMIRALQESNDLTGIAYIKMYTNLMAAQTKYPIFVRNAILRHPNINKRLEKEIKSIKNREKFSTDEIKILAQLALIRPLYYKYIKKSILHKTDKKLFEWFYSNALIKEQTDRLNKLKEDVGIESNAYRQIQSDKNNQKKITMATKKLVDGVRMIQENLKLDEKDANFRKETVYSGIQQLVVLIGHGNVSRCR